MLKPAISEQTEQLDLKIQNRNVPENGTSCCLHAKFQIWERLASRIFKVVMLTSVVAHGSGSGITGITDHISPWQILKDIKLSLCPYFGSHCHYKLFLWSFIVLVFFLIANTLLACFLILSIFFLLSFSCLKLSPLSWILNELWPWKSHPFPWGTSLTN